MQHFSSIHTIHTISFPAKSPALLKESRSTPVHLKSFMHAVHHFCLLVSALHHGKIHFSLTLEPRGGSCF